MFLPVYEQPLGGMKQQVDNESHHWYGSEIRDQFSENVEEISDITGDCFLSTHQVCEDRTSRESRYCLGCLWCATGMDNEGG